jgi:hypothetical protein
LSQRTINNHIIDPGPQESRILSREFESISEEVKGSDIGNDSKLRISEVGAQVKLGIRSESE